MGLLAPIEGEQVLLGYILNQTPGFYLRLFTAPVNEADINASITLASLTEPVDTSYDSQLLEYDNWTISTVGTTTTAAYNDAVSFTFTGAQSIYGYFVTNTNDGSAKVLWIERFPGAPYTLPVTGGTITISPQLGLQ